VGVVHAVNSNCRCCGAMRCLCALAKIVQGFQMTCSEKYCRAMSWD
jgi:hypothetical protein